VFLDAIHGIFRLPKIAMHKGIREGFGTPRVFLKKQTSKKECRQIDITWMSQEVRING